MRPVLKASCFTTQRLSDTQFLPERFTRVSMAYFALYFLRIVAYSATHWQPVQLMYVMSFCLCSTP
jgi:hypothetical protein